MRDKEVIDLDLDAVNHAKRQIENEYLFYLRGDEEVILCSATSGNPIELAEAIAQLCEENVELMTVIFTAAIGVISQNEEFKEVFDKSLDFIMDVKKK